MNNEKINQLTEKMTPEQKAKLNQVLNNESALENLLKSPQAQELIKKFMGDKNA